MGDLLLFKEGHPELLLQCNRLIAIFKQIAFEGNYLGVVRVNDVVYVTWYYGYYAKYLVFKSIPEGVYLYQKQTYKLIENIDQVKEAIAWLQSR